MLTAFSESRLPSSSPNMLLLNKKMGRTLLIFILASYLCSCHLTEATAALFCNRQTPTCTLSPRQAISRFLTPYDRLRNKLRAIRRSAPFKFRMGSLIRNKRSGIVNIDVPLLPALPNVKTSVCGPDTSPTIRQAVVCTVQNDAVQPPRGNTNTSSIGFSTQGRAILAVRIGNRKGKRIMIVTQQHGNEVASTEGVLNFLTALTKSRKLRKRILRLNLLFIIRANPDGGEPTAVGVPPQGPFTGSAGLFRQNVDPSAGGGFVTDTEEGFFGVVGRGYDLNRYHHVRLDAAIRPVETQAIVAALHAFRPSIVFDLHGDVQKTTCEIDPSSVIPGDVFGVLPSAKCLPPADPVPTVLTQREKMVIASFFLDDRASDTGTLSRQERKLRGAVTKISQKLQPRLVGKLARFSQILAGFATLSRTVLHKAPQDLGIAGTGFEVLNFVTEVLPAATSVKIEGGVPVPQFGPDLYLPEPCFLEDNICLHNLLLRKMLILIARKIVRKKGEDNFCDLPVANGLILKRPARFGWGAESDENDGLIPQGEPLGVPVDKSGTCPTP